MKFRKLLLYTQKIEENLTFYSEILGIEPLEITPISFRLQLGWTELVFEKSIISPIYHFCFLIPSNKLEEALEWMQNKTPILDTAPDKKTVHFENWNADSFYFREGSGNILEFIVHHELKNETAEKFDLKQVLGINEMGLPTRNIKEVDEKLSQKIGSAFWKGDYESFGTHGTPEGKFLLPNVEIKKTWFPTDLPSHLEPFIAWIENQNQLFKVEFDAENLDINLIENGGIPKNP
jgi:catechol 2,3-dioxygenase-like lactoylglutathione lyase family enzyme